MTETAINETPERKGSYLDRGFPMGKTLLGILGIVFFLQSLSAWKIMNLEREKASFEAERQNFHLLKQQLPDLQKTTSDLEMKKLELQGDVDTLEKRKTMTLGELKLFEQKANDLKSANEFTESRLKNTDNLLTERKAKCEELQAQQKNFNEEVSALESKIKEYHLEFNALQERVNKLRGEEKGLEVKIVRLETREEELRKLNSEFSNVIANLKSGSSEFEKYQHDIKTGLQNTKQTLEDATQNMRNSVTKLDQEVTNLKNASFDLRNNTDQSANKLKISVDQLSNTSAQSGPLLEDLANELKSFQQKQVTMAETQNKFEILLRQIENSAKDFNMDKLGLQEVYKKLKEETLNAIKKIEELRDVNLKLQKEFDGLRKTINTLPHDEGVKAAKQ